MRIQVKWRLPTIIVTLQDDFQPLRLHVEHSEDQNARMGAGRRVVTIRPDHFNDRWCAKRTLWLEQSVDSGFLLLFDAEGKLHSRQQISRGIKRISLECLQKAAAKDQIGVLEAKECLQRLKRTDTNDPYAQIGKWRWSIKIIGDALLNGIEAERECTLRLLSHAPSALIEQLSVTFRCEGIAPSQLDDHAKRFANLLNRRASENPSQYPETQALLSDPQWLALLIEEDPPPTWDETKIREALKGDPTTQEWRSAVRMAAMRMQTDKTYELLLEQTYRQLDERARSHLAEQLCVLIRRFNWQDVQQHIDSLFSDLINRPAFQFTQRGAMLAAFLDCAERLKQALQRQHGELQKLERLLYKSAQGINQWCNELRAPLNTELVLTAARAIGLSKNPQLQGTLIQLAKDTAHLPRAQGAVFKAIGALQAEETTADEPIAQLLASALRQADAEGRHAAALDALEQFVPYQNSRTTLELIESALRGRPPVSDEHKQRLIGLIGKHHLFDLNNIATDALMNSCLERPEWRQTIMETWRAVPDPHFVRGRLIASLSKDANLREWLDYVVPQDNDFAPLRDILRYLGQFDDLQQMEKELLERLRRMGNLINDVVGGSVRLPERIADVNGFLEDVRAYMDVIKEHGEALNRQISNLIQQGGVHLGRQSELMRVKAELQATRDMLREQLNFIRSGIPVSSRALNDMRSQLQRLRNSPDMDNQVAGQLQAIEGSLGQLQSSQTDFDQQRRALESALRQVEDQIRQVDQALSRLPTDPNKPLLERLTEERQRIGEVISQFQPEDINDRIRNINERRSELQVKRDQAVAEWNDPQRMAERRSRLQTRLEEKRRERLNELRTYRKSLES